MAVTLEKIKQYLRIDSNYEDELISSFIPVAAAYLKAAVTDYDEKYQSDEAFAEEADFLQMLLVGEMYQNRDGRNDPRNDYSYAVRSVNDSRLKSRAFKRRESLGLVYAASTP